MVEEKKSAVFEKKVENGWFFFVLLNYNANDYYAETVKTTKIVFFLRLYYEIVDVIKTAASSNIIIADKQG